MSIPVLRSTPNILGIDFGVSSLKVLQIGAGDPPSLVGAALAPVPKELHDRPAERFAFHAQALGRLLRESGLRGKRAACTVSAATTLVQHMRVQGEEVAPVHQQIAHQLRERVGCNPSKYIIRYHKVGEVHRDGQRFVEVLCTVMPRETVLQHMEAIKACRLEVVGVHCEQFVLARVLDAVESWIDRSHPVMVLDVGHGFTKMVIVRGENPAYAKTIDLGGRSIDARLAKWSSCSLEDAHTRRLESGIPGLNTGARARPAPAMAGAGAGAGSGTLHPMETPDLHDTRGEDSSVRDVVDGLIHEVRLGLRHYAITHPTEPVGSLLLTGGESRNTQLCRYIGEAIGVRTLALDPFTLLGGEGRRRVTGVDVDRPQPGWAVPLGLCLSPANV